INMGAVLSFLDTTGAFRMRLQAEYDLKIANASLPKKSDVRSRAVDAEKKSEYRMVSSGIRNGN
ncbi:MAG: hypothetical protein ACUZ8H_02520, partial [Candidatus Anammoxibacter sp.]